MKTTQRNKGTMKKYINPVDVQLIAGILYVDFRAVLRDRPKLLIGSSVHSATRIATAGI